MNTRLTNAFSNPVVREYVRSLRSTAALARFQVRRQFGAVDRRLMTRYLAEHPLRKLHIGCGGHMLDGWLNADLHPRSASVLHLDATKPFPFGDAEIDYIFSEHMIEHIPYGSGVSMLRECHRVLRKGGKIRISTPDLAFLVALYGPSKTDERRRYIEWASSLVPDAPYASETFVINNFVRAWGHQFIYDAATLTRTLESLGFLNIESCAIRESDDAHLRGLENEDRMPAGFVQLETFTLEATKR